MQSNLCLSMLAVASLVLTPTVASAAAQRAFVSSTGVDNVNCSLASPCRAFAAAITATSAGGEVVVLDSGGYGPVTITKSVSLIAPAGIYAGITVFGGDGVTVNAPGATVVLRGLTINGVGGASGVTLQQAARLRIESCVISNLVSAGIVHNAAGAELTILDTIVRDNGGAGILAAVDASSILDHVRVEHNGGGGIFIQSVSTLARAIVRDSVVAFNGSNGIWIASSGSGSTSAQVEHSILADNGAAGLRISGAGSIVWATATRNTIHGNAGAGVALTRAGAGNAIAIVSESQILLNSAGISADGSGAVMYAGANSVAENGFYDLWQANSASFYSYGNNLSAINKVGTINVIGGQ